MSQPGSAVQPRTAWVLDSWEKRKKAKTSKKQAWLLSNNDSSRPSYFSVRFTLESRTQTTATISKRVEGKRASFLKEKKSLIFSFLLQDRVIVNCKLWISDYYISQLIICTLRLVNLAGRILLGDPLTSPLRFGFMKRTLKHIRMFLTAFCDFGSQLNFLMFSVWRVSIIKGHSAWIENFTLFKNPEILLTPS